MALDPNIALGVRPLELANPLAQYGQVAQIQAAQQAQQMNALKMQEYQRNVESQNALRGTPAPEGVNPEHWKIDPKEALALAKTAAETKNLGATYGHLTAQTNDLTIKALGSTFDNFTKLNPPTVAAASPEGVAAYIKNLYADPLLGAVAAKQMPLDEAIKINTEGWAKDPKAWATAHMGLTGEKLFDTLKGTRQNVNQGGTSLGQTVDAYGRVVPGSAVNTAMTATPDAKMANVVAQGNLAVNQSQLALAQTNATKPVFNPATGGFITPPTQANPQGTFTPVAGIQETKDQQAAVKALKSAGYDPTTGEDNISKLIAKSTSGGLQAGTAATLAFFGKSTEGRKAIAALEGTANQIATDLAGGKLGAGISNTDRDFIVGALGDVSNPMKTSAERLAGWAAAKNRMVNAGVIPAPAGAAVAPNLDALLNKYK